MVWIMVVSTALIHHERNGYRGSIRFETVTPVAMTPAYPNS
jgi:hypothetical protein